MEIPTDLKRGLKAFGSKAGLADALGVTTQTIWRWEHGASIPLPMQRFLRRLVEEKAVGHG